MIFQFVVNAAAAAAAAAAVYLVSVGVSGLGPLGLELGVEHHNHRGKGRIVRAVDVFVISPAIGGVARVVVELNPPELSVVPLHACAHWVHDGI